MRVVNRIAFSNSNHAPFSEMFIKSVQELINLGYPDNPCIHCSFRENESGNRNMDRFKGGDPALKKNLVQMEKVFMKKPLVFSKSVPKIFIDSCNYRGWMRI